MKFDLRDLADIGSLAESVDVECKLAQGADGQGALPRDFWPTYSAMANTQGGVVLLGVRELRGRFEVAGVRDIQKLRTELFNGLNNPEKVNVNLLAAADVQSLQLDGKTVLVVHVPRATRKQRPVYLNGRPMGHTFKRGHDGDHRCDDEAVRRMLAEQVEDLRDNRILKGFGMDDLDAESLRVYRQMLRDEKPGHPWLELTNDAFMRQLGAWRRDRESGDEGLTLAGLLMFGQWSAIQDAVPHYFVDYQERPEARAERRWVDRVVPDGTWSGNLFDFYRRVYRKLAADLKVPFVLRDGQRQDDTPVHVALREALVNCLVHADYTGRVSVLVVKRPDMFGFRNPGGLRLPLDQVLHGGESDCRNRLMHQMFLMIGLGERAGSGIPKILSGWQSQHWRQPLLREKDDPEQTLLELHMLDLLPEPVLAALRQRFGPAFDVLDRDERLVMATAAIEQHVNHGRLAEICGTHPHDLSLKLARLERDGLLQASGQSRAKVYFLPGTRPVSPEDVFSAGAESGAAQLSGAVSGPRSGQSEGRSVHSEPSSGQSLAAPDGGLAAGPRDADGLLRTPLLPSPVVDDLSQVQPALREQLEAVAALPRRKKHLPRAEVEAVILALCTGRFVRLSALAQLMSRNPDALRRQFLNDMVQAQRLERAFPATPNHEMQSYRTTGR